MDDGEGRRRRRCDHQARRVKGPKIFAREKIHLAKSKMCLQGSPAQTVRCTALSNAHSLVYRNVLSAHWSLLDGKSLSVRKKPLRVDRRGHKASSGRHTRSVMPRFAAKKTRKYCCFSVRPSVPRDFSLCCCRRRPRSLSCSPHFISFSSGSVSSFASSAALFLLLLASGDDRYTEP